ncbi:MAG: hypothetical protein H7039_19830 [Bryobacteraceae bacterium]|nr:hypothetical protein [Bryobacteraceae bacterium]
MNFEVKVFTNGRNRLLEGHVARRFCSKWSARRRKKDLTSDEHFTVDGTLIEARASALPES